MNDLIPQWPSPGIFAGVSEMAYHGHKGVVSKSLLWDFFPNPHKWRFGPAKEQTAAMAYGSMIDALWLAESFNEDFVIIPDDAPPRPQERHVNAKKPSAETLERAEWWAKFDADLKGRTAVTQADYDAGLIAVDALSAHPIASQIRTESDAQISVLVEGIEPETGEGFRAKGRMDLVPHEMSDYSNWLFDLKTTRSVTRHDIQTAIASFGYYAQAALYLDLYNTASGDARSRFGFIFQESEPPYEIAVVELGPTDIEAGRAWYQKALALWCRCERDGNWPSPWDDSIQVVSRPGWARKGDEE